MNTSLERVASKVPAITFGFWIIKILATALGETVDSVLMTSFGETTASSERFGVGGYLVGAVLFGVPLVVLVWAQIWVRRFHPWLYWATIVTSATCGMTLADFADRSLELGFQLGSLILFACVLFSLFVWLGTKGYISVSSVADPKVVILYWTTATFCQSLGTALGDWIAGAGPGYSGGALVFGLGLAVLAVLYFVSKLSHVALFWAAFILSRPLSEAVGDFLDRPLSQGGLDFSRPTTAVILAVVVFGLILILPQRPSRP